MANKPRLKQNYPVLVIHSTDNSFGFGYRENDHNEKDELLIKQFDNDLCSNLIVEFSKFISKENLQKVHKIFVSIGPANFNASRLIVVLARTISQQLNCSLYGFSTFQIMAKRIAVKQNIFTNKKSFWIYKKLKRRGFIAGKYEICYDEENSDLVIRETVIPRLVKELQSKELFYEANYEDEKDLTELLDLANKNLLNLSENSWQNVLPLYPISPIN